MTKLQDVMRGVEGCVVGGFVVGGRTVGVISHCTEGKL